MTERREVSWAKELGIDMSKLQAESPLSGESIRAKRKISKKAAEYWTRERFLAQLHRDSVDTIPDTQPEPVKKPRNKAKVRKYDFTDLQLDIAMRALNAKDSV